MGKIGEFRRRLAPQGIAPEVQKPDFGQVTQLRRNGSTEPHALDVQMAQTAEPAQRRRNRSIQLIVSEVEVLEARRVAQLARQRPRELVPVEVQRHQMGEVAQLQRERSGGAVLDEDQVRDPAIPIRLHSVPIPQGRFGQPIVVPSPCRPPRGVVERHEGPPGRRRRRSAGSP